MIPEDQVPALPVRNTKSGNASAELGVLPGEDIVFGNDVASKIDSRAGEGSDDMHLWKDWRAPQPKNNFPLIRTLGTIMNFWQAGAAPNW